MNSGDNIIEELRELILELRNSNTDKGRSNSFRGGQNNDDFGLKGSEAAAIINSSSSRRTKRSMLKEMLQKEIETLDDIKEKLDKATEEYENAKSRGLKGDELQKYVDNLLEAEASWSRQKEYVDSIDKKLQSTSFSDIANGINNALQKTTSLFSIIDRSIKGLIDPWAKADAAASKYAKTIGRTQAGMESLRKSTIDNVKAANIGIDFNVSVPELLEAQAQYSKVLGRAVSIDNGQQENLAAMHSLMGGREIDLAEAFEKFGVGLNGVADHMYDMFSSASKQGLSFEKYSENVTKNIKIAQSYTFKNGLKGLESMAKKATALKLDMGQVATFAEKVGTVEGSIEVASKLQVLGGPFAQFADPLGMLAEGLTDMEGLTDRLVNMIGGLGRFDKTTGEFNVSAPNKVRIKAAAQAMGLDASQLIEMATTKARRDEVERQLISSGAFGRLSEDMRELIKNTATIDTKTGKATVSIGGKPIEVGKLENKQYDTLIKETQGEASDIKDIARTLRSTYEILSGADKQREAVEAGIIEKSGIGGGVAAAVDSLARIETLLKVFSYVSMAGTVVGGVANIATLFRGAGSGGVGGGGRLYGRLFRRGGAAGHPVPIAGNEIAGQTGRIVARRKLTEKMGRFGMDALTGGKNLGTKLTEKGFRRLGGGLTKYVESRAASHGVTIAKKGGARIAEKTATKLGASMLKGAVKGGGLGIIGAIGNVATDMAVESGKIKKGGVGHYAAKMGSTALEGAALGALAGPIGMAIGGAIGATVGAVKATKARRDVVVDTQLEKMGIQKKGDYGARSLKLIDKALQTGEISDRMRRKLIYNGDTELLDAINKKKEELEAKEQKKFESRKGIFGKQSILMDKGIINVGTAYINTKNQNTVGAPQRVMPLLGVGQLLLGKTNRIRVKPEDGSNKYLDSLRKNEQENLTKNEDKNETLNNKSTNNNLLGNGKLDINISGSIKLVGANGREIDVTDKFIKNDNFINELTKKIINQINLNKYGVNKQDNNVLFRS